MSFFVLDNLVFTFNTLMARAISLIPRALVKKVSRRYVAGDTLDEAVERIRTLNALGFVATVDVLGETTVNLQQSDCTTDAYIDVLSAIRSHRLRANLSVKPTALGLLLDEGQCERNFDRILVAAKRDGNFVRIDMEDSSCTQKEIDLLARLKSRHDNVGIVLQAYLKRTYADIELLIGDGANLRLCKGIYVEDHSCLVAKALSDRRAINEHFLHHIGRCFDAGTYVGIATHDEAVVSRVITMVQDRGIEKTEFEFQMLLGVCEPLRDKLLGLGYQVRIYVPYGDDWYGYSMRRIKENPRIAGHLVRATLFRR